MSSVREEQREPKACLSLSYGLPCAAQVTLSVQLKLCWGYTWLTTVYSFMRSNKRERLHLLTCSVSRPPSHSLPFKPPRHLAINHHDVCVHYVLEFRKTCVCKCTWCEACARVLLHACFTVCVCVGCKDIILVLSRQAAISLRESRDVILEVERVLITLIFPGLPTHTRTHTNTLTKPMTHWGNWRLNWQKADV